jgi:alanine racemase
MPRPIQATIHRAMRCSTTWRVLRAAAPDARVWAVVKANAYGHGIERVFEGLRGADGFALLDLDEAQRVRALGWRGPILLLEGVFEAARPRACARAWTCGTPCTATQQIDMLAAHKTQRAAPRVPEDEFRA